MPKFWQKLRDANLGFTSAGVYKSQITAWEALTGINIPEDD